MELTSSSDSYTYDSYEFSEPEFNDSYDLQYADPPIQADGNPFPEVNDFVPDPDIPDPAIAICHSLNQSKELIQNTFGVSPNHLRSSSVSGLVVLPLKDINLIRKDTRSNRQQVMALILPVGDQFQLAHNDLAQLIQILNN